MTVSGAGTGRNMLSSNMTHLVHQTVGHGLRVGLHEAVHLVHVLRALPQRRARPALHMQDDTLSPTGHIRACLPHGTVLLLQGLPSSVTLGVRRDQRAG